MSSYHVLGYDEQTGRKVGRTYQAGTEDEARALAQGDRLHPVSITRSGGGGTAASAAVTLPYQSLRSINIALAVQISAGSTTADALDSIHRTNAHRPSKRVLYGVRERVRMGKSLSEALGEYPRVWADSDRAMVRAAELRDPLIVPAQIEEIVRYSDEREDLKKMMASKVFMPMVSGVVALSVMVLIMTFTLPRMGDFFRDMGIRDLPGITTALIAGGKLITAFWPWLVGGIVLFLLTIGVLAWRGKLGPVAWAVGRNVPILKRILRLQAYTRFTSVFGVMFRATALIDESLGYAADVIPDPKMRLSTQLVVAAMKTSGVDFVALLRQSGQCDDAFLNCIATEKARLQAPAICEKFVSAYLREIAYLAGRFGQMIELATLAFMLGCVLLILYSIGAPMLQMYMKMAERM